MVPSLHQPIWGILVYGSTYVKLHRDMLFNTEAAKSWQYWICEDQGTWLADKSCPFWTGMVFHIWSVSTVCCYGNAVTIWYSVSWRIQAGKAEVISITGQSKRSQVNIDLSRLKFRTGWIECSAHRFCESSTIASVGPTPDTCGNWLPLPRVQLG